VRVNRFALAALACGALLARARAGDEQTAPGAAPPSSPAPAELELERRLSPPERAGSLEGGPRALAFSADGARIAVAGQDGEVSVIDLGGGSSTPRSVAHHEASVAGAAFIQRGERELVASVGDDGSVVVAPVDSGTPATRPLALGPLTALAVLDPGPGSPRLVAGSARGAIALLSVQEEIVLERTIEPAAGSEAQVAGIAALGRERIAVASWDGVVRTIDVTAGKELRSSRVASVELTAIASTPDGRVLAVGSWATGVELLDASSLRPLAPAAEPHAGATSSLALGGSGASLEGFRLVTASLADETLAISDLRRERFAATLRSKVRGVPSAVALSPDATRIACASFDGAVALYRLAPRGGDSKKEDRP
jgi:WD40 repeat protein